jgi:hypothetical protein
MHLRMLELAAKHNFHCDTAQMPVNKYTTVWVCPSGEDGPGTQTRVFVPGKPDIAHFSGSFRFDARFNASALCDKRSGSSNRMFS